jgi:precorrin-6B methylase 2
MAGESDVPPTVGAQLAHAKRLLVTAGSSAPGDEALALLSSLLGIPTALLAQSEGRMSPSQVETYTAWTVRRAAGEALSPLTGHLAFLGLDLTVSSNDPLLPPGAQRLVEVALACARRYPPGDLLAAEIGTGCGAIALALAAFEPRFARIYAIEPSATALETASANGARYLLNLVVSWQEGDGLLVVPEPVDLIVCGQLGNTRSPQFQQLLELAPAKLRSGGALLGGLASVHERLASERFARALPGAQIWGEPLVDGVSVTIAQLPRPARGDAAFEIRS